MTRYFFNLHDHVDEVDRDGTELPDPRAARVEAVVFAGSMLRDQPDLLQEGRPLRVEVTDDQGAPVCWVAITLGTSG